MSGDGAQTGDFGIVLAQYGGGFEDICEIYEMEVVPGTGHTSRPHKHEGHGPSKWLQYMTKK